MSTLLRIWSTLICVGIFWLTAAPLRAQEAAPGGVTPGVRPLWTEAAITVAMVGVALYAVCRNSNRN